MPQKIIPSEQNLTITRVFFAPRVLLWRAFTEPDFFMQWWGADDFTAQAIEIDLRVGGKRLNCMRAPDGRAIWTAGVYREIIAPGWLVYTDSFVDAERNVVPASYYGMNWDWPLETLITVMFQEYEGETVVTLSYAGIPPGKSREEIQAVWNQSFDKLTTILHEKIKVKGNSAIFILFFGIALLEAFQSHNWLEAILFVFLGLYFLKADNEQ